MPGANLVSHLAQRLICMYPSKSQYCRGHTAHRMAVGMPVNIPDMSKFCTHSDTTVILIARLFTHCADQPVTYRILGYWHTVMLGNL
jgi:hypothetical protein